MENQKDTQNQSNIVDEKVNSNAVIEQKTNEL